MDQPDYQLVENWDPGALAYNYFGAGPYPQSSPPIPCSQYAAVYVNHETSNGLIACQLNWYEDDTLTYQLGAEEFCTDGNITGALQLLIPSLGPSLQVVLQELPGSPAPYSSAAVMLTNRTCPALALNSAGLLMNAAPALGAGATVTEYPAAYAGAISQWWLTGGAEGITVQWQTLNAHGLYVPFYQESVAAGQSFVTALRIPAGAFNVTVKNLSATTANNTATVVGSQSFAGN